MQEVYDNRRIFAEGDAWKGRGSQKVFYFKLLKRHHEFALLEKTKDLTEYEVVKIRAHKKDRYIKGRLVSQCGSEYLPGDEEWGRYGWSYRKIEDAEKKLSELEEV